MAGDADIRKGRHVVYALHAHLVFVTKYRRDALSRLAIRDLVRIFAKVCRDFEAELIECNGEDDHVHLLLVYPPKVALSKLVNSLKGVSSRLLREWRPEVRGRTRTLFCGRHPISSLHAAARHFRLSLTTSNPKEKRPPGALAYLPGLKAGVSREVLDELTIAAAARGSPLTHSIGVGKAFASPPCEPYVRFSR